MSNLDLHDAIDLAMGEALIGFEKHLYTPISWRAKTLTDIVMRILEESSPYVKEIQNTDTVNVIVNKVDGSRIVYEVRRQSLKGN